MSRIFTLTITMDNVAFTEEDNGAEVARILRHIGYRVDATFLAKERQPVLDINGNTVGHWEVVEDDEDDEDDDAGMDDDGLGEHDAVPDGRWGMGDRCAHCHGKLAQEGGAWVHV